MIVVTIQFLTPIDWWSNGCEFAVEVDNRLIRVFRSLLYPITVQETKSIAWDEA
jgi:hypothetical protein